VIPDNTRSDVNRACRYEPDLNRTYHELAMHYGVGVLPARPYRPRDKAKVETGVQVVERWIVAALRHRKFFSLAELNQAIRELLTKLNQRPFRKRPGCRASLFQELDRPALGPLPRERYEFHQWAMALWPLIVYPYFFPAVFFGWHYGGRVWVRMAGFVDRFDGMAGLIAAAFFLGLRLTVAIYGGVFGGGIVQFLRYRKILALRDSLTTASSTVPPAGRTGRQTADSLIPSTLGPLPAGTAKPMATTATSETMSTVAHPSEFGAAYPEVEARPSYSSKRLALTAGGGLAVVVIGFLVAYFVFFSPMRKLLRSANLGNLVTPRGESAYDVYQRMKADGLSSSDLGELWSKVLPLLKSQGDNAFRRWHDESDLTREEWNNLEKLYTWAVDLDANDPNLKARLEYCRGQLQFFQNNFYSAEANYQEAARLAPNWAMASNALGRVAVRLKNHQAAEAHYQNAVTLEPNWVFPNLNLAGVYMRKRDFNSAVYYYERAARLAPDRASVHNMLGQAYEQLKRYDDAREQYQLTLQIVERSPDEEINREELLRRIARIDVRRR